VINLNPEGITKSYILKLQNAAHRLAINEKQDLIYVLNIWSRSVVSIDGRTNTISEPVYLQGACDMVLDPETSRICILGENVISEIDKETGKLICSSEELYIVSHAKMAFDFSRNTAYLTNRTNKSVDVIDLKVGKMTGSILLGKKPLDIRIDPESKIIYVGTDSPATLIIIDVNTNKIIKQIDLHVKKSIWRFASEQRYFKEIHYLHSTGRLYILYKQPFSIPEGCFSCRTEYQDGILIYDLNNDKIIGEQMLRLGLNQLCLDPKNNKIYAYNSLHNDIEVLNEDGYSEFFNFRLQGDRYECMALNPTTNKLYIAVRERYHEAALEVHDIPHHLTKAILEKEWNCIQN
jgi:DNA-binding beta-propeller fold protein YncE